MLLTASLWGARLDGRCAALFQGLCWGTLYNSTDYTCSVISLTTPWSNVDDQQLEVGRLYRMLAAVDEECECGLGGVRFPTPLLALP